MDCAQAREYFDDAYFSLLSESETDLFFAHLKECVTCAENYDRLKNGWENLKRAGEIKSAPPLSDSVLAKLRRKPLYLRKWFLAASLSAACLLLLTFFYPPHPRGVVMGWRPDTEVLRFFADALLDTSFELKEDVVRGAASVAVEISVEGAPLEPPQAVTVRLNGEEKNTHITDKCILPFKTDLLKTNNSLFLSKSFGNRLRVTLVVTWRTAADGTSPAKAK